MLLLLLLSVVLRGGGRGEGEGEGEVGGHVAEVGARAHEAVDDVDGDREDDGGVVLRRDAVQGLEIPQLKKYQF